MAYQGPDCIFLPSYSGLETSAQEKTTHQDSIIVYSYDTIFLMMMLHDEWILMNCGWYCIFEQAQKKNTPVLYD